MYPSTFGFMVQASLLLDLLKSFLEANGVVLRKYEVPCRTLVSFWPLILPIPHGKASPRRLPSCLLTTLPDPSWKRKECLPGDG